MADAALTIPRHPFVFDSEGFEYNTRYNVHRKHDGYRITFHKVLVQFAYDGHGCEKAVFDVSFALATVEALDGP